MEILKNTVSPHPTELRSIGSRKAVFLVADMTHDEELNFPRYWLEWEGAKVVLAGLKKEHTSRYGRPIHTQLTVSELMASQRDCDAVIIPGGYGPDKLRTDPSVQEYVRWAFEDGKVVAAVCHGAQVLISAGIVKGRTLTCVPAVAIDVINAGGKYVDKPLVVDGNLITSRHPPDLPPFTEAIMKALREEKVKVPV